VHSYHIPKAKYTVQSLCHGKTLPAAMGTNNIRRICGKRAGGGIFLTACRPDIPTFPGKQALFFHYSLYRASSRLSCFSDDNKLFNQEP
jgi:hypothetical protein